MRIALLGALLAAPLGWAVAAQDPAAGQTPVLQFQFLGNEAFAIRDGTSTLVSDFPYQSGYSGYMSYRAGDVQLAGRVTCLITHEHLDHFEPAAFLARDWRIYAPPGITRELPAARVLPFSAAGKIDAIEVQAFPTPHTALHHSYLVTWHGYRLYFSGDTAETKTLLAAKNLDVAFVTPWLLDAVLRAGGKIDAKKIVVYHHRQDEKLAFAVPCTVPKQGERFELRRAG